MISERTEICRLFEQTHRKYFGDIDLRVTTKYTERPILSHLTPSDTGWRLGIHWDEWEQIDPEERWVVVLHHVAHTRHPGYTDDFWTAALTIWANELGDQPRSVDPERIRNRMHAVFGRNTPTDPDPHVETLERITGYEYEWLSIDLSDRSPIHRWDPDLWIQTERLDTPDFSDWELYQRLTEFSQWDGIVCPEIRVEPQDDRFRVIDGERTAALFCRMQTDSIPVIIEEPLSRQHT